jgi:sulfur relay (sulfurtransferase) DsrC/TusE family protein
MTREKILDFVRDYYDETGKIPSVRTIAKEVEGVNRANFYGFISSTDELPIALGIKPQTLS